MSPNIFLKDSGTKKIKQWSFLSKNLAYGTEKSGKLFSNLVFCNIIWKGISLLNYIYFY